MTWYVIYSTTSGSLFSQGSAPPSPLPGGLITASLAEQPAASQMWDGESLIFVPRPAKVLRDRLQDILTHPDYALDLQVIWAGLTAPQKTLLRNGLIRLLGRERFRPDGENVTIGGGRGG